MTDRSRCPASPHHALLRRAGHEDDLRDLAAAAALGGGHRQVYNLIGEELGVSTIAFGTREALYAVRTEEPFMNRFPPFPLPRWELEDPEYWRLLNSFGRFLPLREPSELTTRSWARGS